MKSAYPKIFEPITIKRTTIKNRIAMTPMGTNYGETSGEMSNRHITLSAQKAALVLLFWRTPTSSTRSVPTEPARSVSTTTALCRATIS